MTAKGYYTSSWKLGTMHVKCLTLVLNSFFLNVMENTYFSGHLFNGILILQKYGKETQERSGMAPSNNRQGPETPLFSLPNISPLCVSCLELYTLRTLFHSWVGLWAPVYCVFQDDITDPSVWKLACSLPASIKKFHIPIPSSGVLWSLSSF